MHCMSLNTMVKRTSFHYIRLLNFFYIQWAHRSRSISCVHPFPHSLKTKKNSSFHCVPAFWENRLHWKCATTHLSEQHNISFRLQRQFAVKVNITRSDRLNKTWWVSLPYCKLDLCKQRNARLTNNFFTGTTSISSFILNNNSSNRVNRQINALSEHPFTSFTQTDILYDWMSTFRSTSMYQWTIPFFLEHHQRAQASWYIFFRSVALFLVNLSILCPGWFV